MNKWIKIEDLPVERLFPLHSEIIDAGITAYWPDGSEVCPRCGGEMQPYCFEFEESIRCEDCGFTTDKTAQS